MQVDNLDFLLLLTIKVVMFLFSQFKFSFFFTIQVLEFFTIKGKISGIWETPTLSTDADSRTDANLKRLHNLSFKKNAVKKMAVILLLFTLLPRSKTTLLPLDFEHFSPNIDNFAPIQKGHFALYFIIFFGGWGLALKLL